MKTGGEAILTMRFQQATTKVDIADTAKYKGRHEDDDGKARYYSQFKTVKGSPPSG